MIFLSRLFLSMSAIAFLLIGLNTLYDPVAAMTAIELQPTSISATNEIRANYRGMHLAFALIMLTGAIAASARRPALWMIFSITFGLVVGRLISLLLDGMPNATADFLLALEIVSTAGAAGLLWFSRNISHEPLSD